MHEFEKNIAGERTKAVLKHKKESGNAYCGAIYGFDIVYDTPKDAELKKNGRLTINEQEFGVIKTIFFSRNSMNISFNQIAEDLNRSNIPSKTGKTFHASTIKAIIDNPIYQQYL
jgi:DNA invertase Pin-like site-specific DNA recombinase